MNLRLQKAMLFAGLVVAGAAGAPPVAEAAEAAAVTVNGVAISAAAFDAEYRWMYNQKRLVHTVVAEQEAVLRDQAVDRVIVWELVRQRLAKDGRATTPAEVDAAVAADRVRIGDPFLSYIGMLGQDEASYRSRTEGVENFKRYQREYLASLQKVSAEEIKAHYEKVDTYRSAEAYRVRYLQVSSFDKAGRLVHGDLAGIAAGARRRLLEGESLEDVAREVTGPQVSGRVSNGNYEVGKSPVYEPVLKPLAKKGDISEVLKVTDNSYLIFRLEEKVPSRAVSLKEALPEIERLLRDVKLNEAIPGHVAGLKKQARITYLDPKYAPKE